MLQRFSRLWVPGFAVGVALIGVWSILAGSALGAEPPNLAGFLQNAPADLVANAEGETYDSRPSLSVAPDGSIWISPT